MKVIFHLCVAQYSWSSLIWASIDGNFEVVKMLLMEIQELEVNAGDDRVSSYFRPYIERIVIFIAIIFHGYYYNQNLCDALYYSLQSYAIPMKSLCHYMK